MVLRKGMANEMLRIGMFSKLGKTTIKTLRHYDDAGLLRPALVDEATGYRYYESGQLFQLHEIVALRQMGFSIPEIAEVQGGRDIRHMLRNKTSQTEQQIQQLQGQLFRLKHAIELQREAENMSYQVVVKHIDECIVFSKRQVIPNYDTLMSLVPSIGEAVGRANPDLKCAEPEYCFNIYHDGEYKETDIDVEICQAVTGMGRETEGIVFKRMPAIQAACVMVKGSYDGLGPAYACAFEWIERNGYEIAGDPRESFIDGIWNQDDEANWLTEVQVPVRAK